MNTLSSSEKSRALAPLFVALLCARIARLLSRIIGREGSSLPGKVLLTLNYKAIQKLSRQAKKSGRKTIAVSATNGKTTTTALLAEILENHGLHVIHNATGANLRSGIATTLLNSRKKGDVAVLEVDEATLAAIAADLQPDIIVLGNLFRDQLDRFGELELLADRWNIMLESLDPQSVTVVYDADDPLIADLVLSYEERAQKFGNYTRTIAYGLDDPSVAQPNVPHAADSRFCRRCAAELIYDHSWVGHLGSWHCPNKDIARPQRTVTSRKVELDGLAATKMVLTLDNTNVDVRLRIPGLYNVYNALGAAAAAYEMGIPATKIAEAIDSSSPSFGRFERIPIPSGGTITLLLVKNPTGLNEVARTLTESHIDVSATMFALNDAIADGQDTSWIWDADIEPLLEQAGVIVTTGERADEFGLRAIYAGMDPQAVIYEPDLEQALYLILERAREFTDHGHAYVLATYTAMLRIRSIIANQGWTRSYWANKPRRKAIRK